MAHLPPRVDGWWSHGGCCPKSGGVHNIFLLQARVPPQCPQPTQPLMPPSPPLAHQASRPPRPTNKDIQVSITNRANNIQMRSTNQRSEEVFEDHDGGCPSPGEMPRGPFSGSTPHPGPTTAQATERTNPVETGHTMPGKNDLSDLTQAIRGNMEVMTNMFAFMLQQQRQPPQQPTGFLPPRPTH